MDRADTKNKEQYWAIMSQHWSFTFLYSRSAFGVIFLSVFVDLGLFTLFFTLIRIIAKLSQYKWIYISGMSGFLCKCKIIQVAYCVLFTTSFFISHFIHFTIVKLTYFLLIFLKKQKQLFFQALIMIYFCSIWKYCIS